MSEIDLLETEFGSKDHFFDVLTDDDGHVTSLCLYDTEYEDFQYNGDLLAALGVLSYLKDLEIEFRHYKISDLSGLANLPKIERLVLEGCCNATDISPLRHLKNLTYLAADSADITSIEPLTELTALETVVLVFNSISNIDALKDLPKLKYVNLSYNKLADISVLASSPELQNLAVSNNQLTDISFLKNSSKLQHLDFSRNAIESIDFLDSLPGLKTLSFSGNPTKSISALSQLNSLTYLSMANVSVENLSPLKSTLHLETLYAGPVKDFDGNIISRFAELAGLQLNGGGISDLSFLLPLKKLSYLSLEDNNISDVTCLYCLAQLRHISLKNNRISEPFLQLNFDRLNRLDLQGNPFGNKLYEYSAIRSGLSVLDADIADYWLKRGDDDKALAYFYVDAGGKIPLAIYYRKLLACDPLDNYFKLYYVMRCERLIKQLEEEDQEILDIKASIVSIVKKSNFFNKAQLLTSLEQGGKTVIYYNSYSQYAIYLKSRGSVKPHPEILYKLAHDTLKGRENLSHLLSIYKQLIGLESPLQITLKRDIKKILKDNFENTPEDRNIHAIYMDVLTHITGREIVFFDIASWFEYYYNNNAHQNVNNSVKSTPIYKPLERSYPETNVWPTIAKLLLALIALFSMMKGCR